MNNNKQKHLIGIATRVGIFTLIALCLIFFGMRFLNQTIDEKNHENQVSLSGDAGKDKKFIYGRNEQLLKAIEHTEWLATSLRKILEQHKSEINEKNCRGILEDIDGDKIFDKSIFGETFSVDSSNIHFHYNFCSFVWSKEEVISIMSSTKELIKKYSVSQKDGKQLVPIYLYKQKKELGSDKIVVVDKVGLVNIDELIF